MPPAKRIPYRRGQASSRTVKSADEVRKRNIDIAKAMDTRLIMGVDPGLTTGMVLMTTGAIIRQLENLPVEKMYEMLTADLAKRVQLVIMEEFIVGSRAAQMMGSRNEASSIIGAVQAWCSIYKIPLVMQMSAIKPIAAQMSQKTPIGAHKANNWLDAFYHVFYWLVTVGLIEANGGKPIATTRNPARNELPSGS